MLRTFAASHRTLLASLTLMVGWLFLLQACGGGGGGGGGGAPSPSNVPRFAYVANQSDNTISMYTVNATTGQLRHNGYVLAGTGPSSVSVDRMGKFAYVANQSSNDISAYLIGTRGTLTQIDCGSVAGAVCNGMNFAAGTTPQFVTVDPTGKFAYVVNQTTDNISAFTINATSGALLPITGSPFPTGTTPMSVAIDPTGKFAYVTNSFGITGNSVTAFSINASTGALTEIDQNGASAGTTVATGNTPVSISIDRTGKFAYVANINSDDVSAYTINATTGALTQINCGGGAGCNGTNFAAGTDPQSVTVDPTGKFVYVANANSQDVSAYTLNATTGALTEIDQDSSGAGTTVPTGVGPMSVSVDPSGKFAFVTNFVSNDVSTYSINATTGALTALSPVRSRSGGMAMAMTKGTSAVRYTPRFAYVANFNSDNATTFSINPSTGALTEAGTEVAAGDGPQSVTVDPTGRFAYVANEGTDNVTTFSIDPSTGALTEVGTEVVAGDAPHSVTVTGQYQ